MPANRFYHPHLLQTDSNFTLEDDECKHVIGVMRAKPGDTVEIVNGCGQLSLCQIETIQKKQTLLRVLSTQELPPPQTETILVQAIPRSHRLDLIVEKGTEIGASAFWFFPAHLSEKTAISDSLRQRLEKIAISAMKQSGRLFLPSISLLPSLDKWERPALDQLLYGDTRPNATPLIAHLAYPKNRCAFFVGPERGWSDKELQLLISWGALGTRLSENILRTETAALVALTLLSQRSLI